MENAKLNASKSCLFHLKSRTEPNFFQIPTLIRYCYGPFPRFLCTLEFLVKNVLVLKMILFIDFTIIVRYIFKFHAKNPTAVQDDFWALFLLMWALGKNLLIFFTVIWLWCQLKIAFLFMLTFHINGKKLSSFLNKREENVRLSLYYECMHLMDYCRN